MCHSPTIAPPALADPQARLAAGSRSASVAPSMLGPQPRPTLDRWDVEQNGVAGAQQTKTLGTTACSFCHLRLNKLARWLEAA